MSDAIVSLILMILLCILIVSPFSALALLMLALFSSALIGSVSVLVRSIAKSTAPEQKES